MKIYYFAFLLLFTDQVSCGASWEIVDVKASKHDGQRIILTVKVKNVSGAIQLGKLNCGKCCIRFKRLEDLPLDVIEGIFIQTVELRGQGGGFICS
ncbi:MAG: hypothetical protein ACSHX9_01500 [Luteolibacter sp.]